METPRGEMNWLSHYLEAHNLVGFSLAIVSMIPLLQTYIVPVIILTPLRQGSMVGHNIGGGSG